MALQAPQWKLLSVWHEVMEMKVKITSMLSHVTCEGAQSEEERWVGGVSVNVLFCRRSTHVNTRQSPTWKMLKSGVNVLKLWKIWCEWPMNIVKCVKMNSSCWNLILLNVNYSQVVKIFPYSSYRRNSANFFHDLKSFCNLDGSIYDILFVCVISLKKLS